MYTAQRYHDISCGHRVHEHESKCAHLHGHNYRVHFICALGEVIDNPKAIPIYTEDLDKVGRVIDFSVIKSELCMWLENNWDHKFLVWSQDPNLESLKIVDSEGVVEVPFNPTAENIAQYLVMVLGPQKLKGSGVFLKKVIIEETAKCSASYER